MLSCAGISGPDWLWRHCRSQELRFVHCAACMPFLPLLLLLPVQADLFHEVARARDHLQRMLQCVGCDMLRHLCSTSVHLPELPLAETAAKQLSGTFSPATMQDVSGFSGFPLVFPGHDHAGLCSGQQCQWLAERVT